MLQLLKLEHPRTRARQESRPRLPQLEKSLYSNKDREEPINKDDKTSEMGNRGISTISKANNNHPVLYFPSPSVATHLQWL